MSREIENIEKLMDAKGAEFRSFLIAKYETRKADGGKEEMVLEGVPCVFGAETVLYKDDEYEYCEQVDSGAFQNADMSDVIFNYNHGGRVYARTRNKSLEVWTESDGLHMRATLLADDEGHAQLYRDITSGLIDKMSFAFHVSDDKYEETKAKTLRTILAIDKLYDVSAVDIPAYDATSISARNTFNAESERRALESAKRAIDKLNLALKIYEGGF